MDEAEKMDPSIIKGLFEQGVSRNIPLSPLSAMQGPALTTQSQLMGIETSFDHGGSDASFTSAILAIEGEWRSLRHPAARQG